jgi:uncharacterized phage-like protein YoqJ
LSGFEVSPTLMERKDRLKTETDNLTIITFKGNDRRWSRKSRQNGRWIQRIDETKSVDFDSHMSRRIKELR